MGRHERQVPDHPGLRQRPADGVRDHGVPPGAKHDIHRHPHAEETEYIVEGHGVARVGDDDVAMGPGDIVFVPTDAYHGFYNTSETERAVMVWCYGGAGTLAEAGYIREGAELRSDESS